MSSLIFRISASAAINFLIDIEPRLTNAINEKDEFAVIQLPKKIIRINGQNLSGDQFAKYEALMKEYKIKHGRSRMILFSPHILKVGNFSEGSFSGTTSLFRLD